jgi:hypothetical protein
VDDALTFLTGLKVPNAFALSDLVCYLEKHRSEIIDYGRRQEAGKVIGSGRMEKGVDQVIGPSPHKPTPSIARAPTAPIRSLQGLLRRHSRKNKKRTKQANYLILDSKS